jgi:hypothetical protein
VSSVAALSGMLPLSRFQTAPSASPKEIG